MSQLLREMRSSKLIFFLLRNRFFVIHSTISRAMLSLGSSKPWPDAMEVLTNNRKMEATAILEYFAPLYEWLVKTNNENGVEIGWDLAYGMKTSFQIFIYCF